MTRARSILGLAAALFIAACAHTQAPATQESIVTASAQVVSVDQKSRVVQLKDDADGTLFSVTAGPEVRNLAQVSKGDHVTVDYYRATTLSMADPADTGEKQTTVVAGRAPEVTLPGAAAVKSESLVVTVISYDPKSGIAVYRTPDGITRSSVVPPSLRRFAEQRGTGARVLVTITEAVAVSVTKG